MPITSRAFVKASILYLGLGAILGALMLINRSIPLGSWVAYVRVSHVQILVVGWLTQLIMGVAWWLFPPLKIGLRPDSILPDRRGRLSGAANRSSGQRSCASMAVFCYGRFLSRSIAGARPASLAS